jgi:hypothetical protein
MKRLVVILSLVMAVILAAGAVAWWRLPSVVTFLLGRAIDGRIEARHSTVSWNGRIAMMELDDVTLSGKVRGTIKKIRLDVRPGRGIYIKYGLISDFDVVIDKEKAGGKFLLFQVEQGEVVRGKAVYKGQTFTINSIKISNFNTAGQFEFSLDGGIDGFGKIRTHGSGVWRNGRSDVSGMYQVSHFDLGRLFRRYEGRCDSKGQVSYRNGEWGLHGAAGADGFVMREDFLKKPIQVAHVDCRIDIETSRGKVHTKLGQLSFKETPLRLAFTNEGKNLEELQLSSGPLDVGDIQEYLSLSFVKRLPTIIDAVSSGRVAVQELIFTKPNSFKALLSLKDMEAHYGELRFVGISGDLRLDTDRMTLANMSARSGNSSFSEISGSVPFSEKKEIKVGGKYDLDLADVARFVQHPQIQLTAGSTAGIAEIRGAKGDEMRIQGAGRLRDAAISWKNLPLSVSGTYTFDRNGIDCTPLTVEKGKSELQVRGRIARDGTDVRVDGNIETAGMAHLFPLPFPLAGNAGIDGRFEEKDGYLSWRGTIDMDALSFDIPGIIKKGAGVPSSAALQLRFGKGDLFIEKLNCLLSTIAVQLEGKVDRNLTSNLRLRVEGTDLDRASDSIAANGNRAKGEVKADLQIEDLHYPFVRLPRMNGYVTVKNASLALPFFARPIDRADARFVLAGHRYEVTATDVRVGTSAIDKAVLTVDGVERPKLAFRVDAANLDMGDLIPKREGPWRLSTIEPGSLLSKTSGVAFVQAKRVKWGRIDLEDLDTSLRFADDRLTLEGGNAGVFGGVVHAVGSADFAVTKPRFRLSGGIERMSWGEMFRATAGDAEVMKGSGAVKAELTSEGEDAREIIGALSGRVTASGSDGVVRKWNLLSKIFGILNVYDLLQGKVNLAEEGLPYTVMSADFYGNNGQFKTRNFVIDSPSMFITGRGAVTLRDETVEGTVAVSPLVTVDKVLSKIPVIRNLLREKREGFLFVVYNVSGPLRDPSIYSTYVESVGLRAYMILKNLIKLPVEVMEQ